MANIEGIISKKLFANQILSGFSKIMVHGGARTVEDENLAKKLLDGVKLAAKGGYKTLLSTSSVLDAVEVAVRLLEDDEHFNAGRGSVLNLEGEVDMDASIMLGSDLSAGAVTVVKDVQNPITLARRVMEKTAHVLLAGEGALKFAKDEGFAVLPPGALVTERARLALETLKSEVGAMPKELSTVGAVAIGSNGQLAVATSTGGFEGKMVGRCSDTSLIGSGTYADDDVGAVLTTGHGETIAKFCLAHAIVKEMELGKTAQDATSYCLEKMTDRLKNTAGAITISKSGEIGIGFNTRNMSWAYQKENRLHFGINHNEHNVEVLY